MAKQHSSLVGSDLHNPKGIGSENTTEILTLSQSAQTVTVSGSLVPKTTNTYDLGTASLFWRDIYVSSGSLKFVNPATNAVIQEIKASSTGVVFQSGSGLVANVSGSTISGSALHIEGDGKITGDFTIGGDITIGDANTDSLSISADLTSNLVPNTDNAYDFGSATKRWRNIYLSGSVSSSGGPHYFNSDTTVGISAVTTLTAKGNGGASFGDDVGTWEFDGAGALSETGMTTVSVTPSSTLYMQGGGVSRYGDDTGYWSFDGSGAVSETGMTTFSLTPSSTVDIDAGGTLTLDGSAITIGGDSDVVVDIDSSTLDIDASGAITIDGTSTVSIDGADDMNFTITSGTGGEDLTIQQIGANDSSIIITAAGTGADAVSIDATAGSMVVAPSLANGQTLTIGPSSATQMVFTPHGTAASEKISLINTSGTADDAIKIDAEAGGLTLAAGNDSLHIDADGTDSDALNIDSAGGIDVDGAGAIDILAGTTVAIAGASTSTYGDDTAVWSFNGSGAVSETGMTTFSLTPSSTVDIDAGGAVTIDSSAAAISVGGDSVAQKISIGGDTSTRTEVELNAILVDINAGSSGITMDAGAASNLTTSGGTITVSGKTGVSIQEDGSDVIAIDTNRDVLFGQTGGSASDPDVEIDGYLKVDGSSTFSAPITASAAISSSGAMELASLTLDTDLAVTHGGTGASSLTDGGVLLGSGTSAVTAMAVLADGEFIVGDGTTDPVAESGDTARTSLGVGTGDSPQFSGLDINGSVTVTGNITGDHGSNNMTIASTNASVLVEGTTFAGNDVTIPGNLTVQGSETIISSSALNVVDKNITIGSGSITSAVMDEGGLDFGLPTIANIRYDHSLTAISSSVDFYAPNVSASMAGTGSFGRLETHQANADFGGKVLTLAGNLETQNNNLTINAADAARTLTLTEDFTIGGGHAGTLTFSAGSKTLTVEDDSTINQDLSSDASVTFNAVTADGGVSIDNITIDGTEIDLSSGDLTIDVAGDVEINADGGDVVFKDATADLATINATKVSGSQASTGSFGRLETVQSNASIGGNIVTLAGDLTTQNNDVTVNAVGAARTLTLNESLTVGNGNDGTITYSGASKTLTVEDNATVSQDMTSDANPTFAGVTAGNVKVGVTGDNEIDTSTGNLTIDSAAGTTTIDDNCTVTGTLTESSSEIYKENISQLQNGLDKVLMMRGVEFDYKSDKSHSIGVVAEEISKIEPYLLSDDKKAVSYTRIVPLLIEAVKSLNDKVEEQNKLIETLKS